MSGRHSLKDGASHGSKFELMVLPVKSSKAGSISMLMHLHDMLHGGPALLQDGVGALILHPAGALLARGQCRLMHGRRHEARSNRIDANVVGRKFIREAFGKTHDGGLGAGVGAVVGKRAERAAAGEIDDPGLLAFLQQGQRVPGEEIRPFQICFDALPTNGRCRRA